MNYLLYKINSQINNLCEKKIPGLQLLQCRVLDREMLHLWKRTGICYWNSVPLLLDCILEKKTLQ